jgi:glutaconyl-CoA/methylmalonyl-CoA decarboxylase subunit gamma
VRASSSKATASRWKRRRPAPFRDRRRHRRQRERRLRVLRLLHRLLRRKKPARPKNLLQRRKPLPSLQPQIRRPSRQQAGAGAVLAPIPGVITKVCVAEGDQVKAGDTVVKLEAMKMENDITALTSGVVKEIAVDEGAEVSDGQLLVLIG